MKSFMNKARNVLKRATRGAKKGIRNVTRRVKRLFHRGGNPNATPTPAAAPAPAAAPPTPKTKKHRKAKKGAFRRVTNAVRRVGKRFRNTLRQVFSKKRKHRRNKKPRVQRGSSETVPVNGVPVNAVPAPSPGIPPAPPL